MPDPRKSSAAAPPSIRACVDADDQITVATTTPSPNQVVIAIGGEVDMLTSPELRGVVLEKLAPDAGIELIVLDLDAVTFLGTSGLAALIEVREAAHRVGVELRLVCTASRVLRPLTIAGLAPMFDIHDTAEQALAAT